MSKVVKMIPDEEESLSKNEEQLVDMLDVNEPHWCRQWFLVTDFVTLLRSCIEQNRTGLRKSRVRVSALEELIEQMEKKK